MRIDKLNVTVTEQELNDLIKKHLLEDLPVSDLSIAFTDGFIELSGTIKKIFTIPFTAWIKPSADGSRLNLELEKLDAAGPLGNQLRGTLMNMIIEKIPPELEATGSFNMLHLDLGKLLSSKGIVGNIHLDVIEAMAGRLKIETSGTITAFKKESA